MYANGGVLWVTKNLNGKVVIRNEIGNYFLLLSAYSCFDAGGHEGVHHIFARHEVVLDFFLSEGHIDHAFAK